MVLSEYTKEQILIFEAQGYHPPRIAQLLRREGITVSRQGVRKFLLRVKKFGTTIRQPGSGKWVRATDAVKDIVEKAMREDDETTGVQLHALLVSKGYCVSLSTVLRCRKSLGWTFRGSAYCQMLREANKAKRLEWATNYLHEAESGFPLSWTSFLQTKHRFN